MGHDLLKYFVYSPEEPMFFTSGIFWGFMAVAILFYSFLFKKPVLRHAYLLLVSLYFYYQAGGWFFLMLIFSTLLDYFLGIRIHDAKSKRGRKIFLIASIAVNLGILVYFKYSYFLVDILSNLT